MTIFNCLRSLAGLSLADSAMLLGARAATIDAWDSGALPCPADVIDELRRLIDIQAEGAARLLGMIGDLQAGARSGIVVELDMTGMSTDDEARSLGYPCASAYFATIARVVAGAPSGVTIRLNR